jgi:hypothetical protein
VLLLSMLDQVVVLLALLLLLLLLLLHWTLLEMARRICRP